MYTTCRSCGDLLHTTDDEHGTYNTEHPGCEQVFTKTERIERRWLQAVLDSDTSAEVALQCELDELDNRPPRLLDAAVSYAKWGWPVFPLKTHSKRPATRRGLHDATTDITRVSAWWTTHPDHNIGLPTGHAFDVIDIDVPLGVPSLLDLINQEDPRTGRGPIPDCHGQVATASGGVHFYIRPTGEGNGAGILPGVDHRGIGGYVVGPPSGLGEPGRTWSWTVKPSPVITRGVAGGNG
jgi:hypothetical protein